MQFSPSDRAAIMQIACTTPTSFQVGGVGEGATRGRGTHQDGR
jgi:hypothetical protein